MNDDVAPVNFPGNSASFNFKWKITGKTGNDGTKAVKIIVPLEYLDNYWRILEMPLIYCVTNLILSWSANCVISNAAVNEVTTFAITDAKLYVLVVTLLTDDNSKLLQQLKSVFKCTINWNKYEPKTATQNPPNQYFNFLIEPSN